MTGVFPSVVPFFKKDSKLDNCNYHPISLLSNIDQIFEKRIYMRLYTFLDNNILSMTYSLDSDNNVLHLMS